MTEPFEPGRWGLLLINLGTPDSPAVPDVRRYLREFLSDPRVIDVPALRRWLILNLFILPFRPKRSAEAYHKIWTDRGSPLLFHGLDLIERLRELLGADTPIELGMRYQNPSIASALARLRAAGIDRITVFPLFPQYSSAAWGSAIEKLHVEVNRRWNVPTLQVVPPYHDHPAYIEACAAAARPVLEELDPDLVLMSYHGLPERQIMKGDESGGQHCLRTDSCCDRIVPANRKCYRAQCYETSRLIAGELDLAPEEYAVTFQSRLGRSPWIRPYTDERVRELATSGVKRLVVLSPSFVADCLETLEEIGLRAAEDFRAHGGEELRLVPSLNSGEGWARAIARILQDSGASIGVRGRNQAERRTVVQAGGLR